MKLTSQMPSSTSLMPTAWPARQVLKLIFLRYRHSRPQLVTTTVLSWNGIAEFLNALIRAAGRRVDLGRTFHVESFVRAFVVELLDEGIELGLLLKQVGAGWASGFFLQRQMHALMTAVLLRMTGPNAFDADAQAQPPDREPGEIEKPVGRSEGNAVIGADRLRQTALFETGAQRQ